MYHVRQNYLHKRYEISKWQSSPESEVLGAAMLVPLTGDFNKYEAEATTRGKTYKLSFITVLMETSWNLQALRVSHHSRHVTALCKTEGKKATVKYREMKIEKERKEKEGEAKRDKEFYIRKGKGRKKERKTVKETDIKRQRNERNKGR
jgi:hypothetical protein